MAKTRIQKFEQIHKFQQQKLDLSKQQLAAQNQQITQLDLQLSQMQQELEQVESQVSESSSTLVSNQQCVMAMMAIQRKINAQKTELASSNEKLDYLLHKYREQDKHLKSWEMLIEQEARKIQSSALLADMQEADQRYLSTQFSGEQR